MVHSVAQEGSAVPVQTRRSRPYFNGKPLSFHESLHWCGCIYCQADILARSISEPPHKPDFATYLAATYPNTTPDAIRARTAPSDTQTGTQPGLPGEVKQSNQEKSE